MDLFILDREFKTVAIIDTFESLIWTDRYYAYGDFELYLPMQSGILSILQKDYYLYLRDSEHLMIIEDFEISTDVETGSHLRVTGRSLESILERRIIWKQTTYSGTVDSIIKTIIEETIISPSIVDRKIENFIFKDVVISSLADTTIEAQYTGDNVYEIVSSLCELFRIGFKVVLNSNNQFEFSLYSGEDRSYNQDKNQYVIFSPSFENIMNSRYIETNSKYRNVTLVAGEGDGADRKMITVGTASGLDRRELFTDARDLSSNTGEKQLTDAEYNEQLTERGEEKLIEYNIKTAFEGKVEATRMFKYSEDFFLGDIVQIANEFGMEGRAYISEIIHSQSNTGLEIYPTFEMIVESEYEDENT